MSWPPRLRDKLLLWSAAVVVLVQLVGTAVVARFEGSRSATRAAERMAPVILEAAAAAWDAPDAMARLAARLHAATERAVVVVASDGSVLAAAGDGCRVWKHGPVRRDGEVLGDVRLCGDEDRFAVWRRAAAMAALGVLVFAAAAWATGRLSHRIARLADTADALGAGDLAHRAPSDDGAPVELRRLASSINVMADRLARRAQLHRDVLATVSHELRSPLARVQAHLDLARAGIDPDEQLDSLAREIELMNELVSDLLASSRVEMGALHAAAVDVVATLRRVVAQLEPSLTIDGDRDDDATPPYLVRGDAGLLARAMSIVIDNALRHGAAPVRLRVVGERSRVTVEVSDAGAGFPDPAVAFEPRTSAGSRAGGVGLGLALAERIVRAHGGLMDARNLTVGAIVSLTLPRQSAADIEASFGSRAAGADAATAATTSSPSKR